MLRFKSTKEFQIIQELAVIQNELVDESIKSLSNTMTKLIQENQIFYVLREILTTIRLRANSRDILYSLLLDALNYIDNPTKIIILQKLFLKSINDKRIYSQLYLLRLLKRLIIENQFPIELVIEFIKSLDIKSFPNTLTLYFIFFHDDIKLFDEKLYDDIINIKNVDWKLEKMLEHIGDDDKELLLNGYKKNNSIIDQIINNSFDSTKYEENLENFEQGELLFTGFENLDQLAAFYGCKEFIELSKPKKNYDFYYIIGGNFELAKEISLTPFIYSRRGPIDTENDQELIDEAIHCSVLFSNYSVFCEFCTDLTIYNSGSTTLLHEACFCGDELLVNLISMNICVNIEQEPNQFTPLHIACEEGFKDIVEILLKEDEIDVNCQSDLLQTPLHLAAKNGFLEIVKILINDSRVNPSITDIKNLTPLEVTQNQFIKEILEPITVKFEDQLESEDEDVIDEVGYG